jgi:hypothetical protein
MTMAVITFFARHQNLQNFLNQYHGTSHITHSLESV